MHPIEKAYKGLPSGILNGSDIYPNQRNVLINCLCREAERSAEEVIDWLKRNKVKVKDLDDYIIKDDTA